MTRVNAQGIMKLTLGGSAWDMQEIWSIGIHLGMVDGSSVETAFEDLDLDGVIGAWITTMNIAGAPSQSQSVSFDEVRLAKFSTGNSGAQIGESRVAFNSVNNGGIDTTKYLPQGSIVVTTNSDILRGKTSKGRFYLPPGYGMPANDGYVPSDTVLSTVGQVNSFLNELADVVSNADPDLRIVNYSAYTPQEPASLNPVTFFTIGNVVDTQRRRRNGLQERYTRGDLA